MDITAIICIREDDDYVANCLSHLIDNDVHYAIIDNGLSDASRELLATSRFRSRLVDLTELPFTGEFELNRQIETKEEIISRLGADWVIHLDVDEIMESHVDGETLAEAIARVDAQGWTVVNFEEYVFLPVDEPYRPGPDRQPLRCYYYFRPWSGPRLMRARKKDAGLTMVSPAGVPFGAGHALFGGEARVAPESFALRHYIVRNQEHALAKYPGRRFASSELDRGWHHSRVGHPAGAYGLPDARALRQLPHADARTFDRSDPKSTHYWQW